MKRIISAIIVSAMVLSNVLVFAEEQSSVEDTAKVILEESSLDNLESIQELITTEVNQQPQEVEKVLTEEFLDNILTEENSIPQEVVDKTAAVEDETKQFEEENKVIRELDNDKEISKANINRVIKNTYKYLKLRDIFYKRVLVTAKKISNLEDPNLKKAAIIKLEQKLQAEKEKDKYVHQVIQKLLDFIKNNKDQMTAKEKAVVNKVLRPMVQKYYRHRAMIVYINKNIEELKSSFFKNDLKKIASAAEEKVKSGDLQKAKEYYEKLAQKGIAGDDVYKKLGLLLRDIEGKGPKVFVKGIRPNFDVKPMIKDGRTMVPFRAIAEALKANVQWDDANRSVVLSKNGKKVIIPINKNYIEVNGEVKEIDVPATIVEDRTMVPVRVVSESLDADVTWDDETQVITIEDSSKVSADISEIDGLDINNPEDIVKEISKEDIMSELNNIDEKTILESLDKIE